MELNETLLQGASRWTEVCPTTCSGEHTGTFSTRRTSLVISRAKLHDILDKKRVEEKEMSRIKGLAVVIGSAALLMAVVACGNGEANGTELEPATGAPSAPITAPAPAAEPEPAIGVPGVLVGPAPVPEPEPAIAVPSAPVVAVAPTLPRAQSTAPAIAPLAPQTSGSARALPKLLGFAPATGERLPVGNLGYRSGQAQPRARPCPREPRRRGDGPNRR